MTSRSRPRERFLGKMDLMTELVQPFLCFDELLHISPSRVSSQPPALKSVGHLLHATHVQLIREGTGCASSTTWKGWVCYRSGHQLAQTSPWWACSVVPSTSASTGLVLSMLLFLSLCSPVFGSCWCFPSHWSWHLLQIPATAAQKDSGLLDLLLLASGPLLLSFRHL